MFLQLRQVLASSLPYPIYCLQSSQRMSKQKKTPQNLSIQTKLQLLADVDKKQGKKKEIAEKYVIPHNTKLPYQRLWKTEPSWRDLVWWLSFNLTEWGREQQRNWTSIKLCSCGLSKARAMSASISTPVLTSQAFKSLQFMSKTSF